MPPLTNALGYSLAIVVLVLAIGSCIRLLSLRVSENQLDIQVATNRRRSLAVWWILVISFCGALLLGRAGIALLFCIASLIALREFKQLFQRHSSETPWLSLGVMLVAIGHYFTMAIFNSQWCLAVFPFLALFVVTGIELANGLPKDFLRTTAGHLWALLLLVWGVSHTVSVSSFPTAAGAPETMAVGWCLFLVLLTESNDIAQALLGRAWGRHRVTPVFSPGKTWEGLAGGFVVTTTLSMLSAPWLTTLTYDRSAGEGMLVSFAAGAVISLAGFMGDVNMSGLKREAFTKDSSTLLPGMGGMIDRLDSLTISAPAFYYFVITFNRAI